MVADAKSEGGHGPLNGLENEVRAYLAFANQQEPDHEVQVVCDAK
jgi:hypothetical protein